MSYAKGAAFEQELARRLRSIGAWVVRAAGSKGPSDLVAWYGGRRALIQAKVGGGLGAKEAQELSLAARDLGATAWLVTRTGRGHEAWYLVWPELGNPQAYRWSDFAAWLTGKVHLPRG
jgi:Holliday junction resolvase